MLRVPRGPGEPDTRGAWPCQVVEGDVMSMGCHSRESGPPEVPWWWRARRFAHDWAYPVMFCYYTAALIEKGVTLMLKP